MEYKTDAVLDIQGNAVFNASVRVLTESRQLATVYNASGVQIPNPVSTDKTGEFSMAMPNGKYYWEISVNGRVYETKGPVSFFDIRDERTSALDYGKLGSEDDTETLQKAINARALAGGGTVLIPFAGDVVVTGLVLKDFVKLEGLGKNVTRIRLKDGANSHVIQAGDFDLNANGVVRSSPVGCKTGGLKYLTIDGNKANQTVAKHGFAYYGIDVQLEEVEFKNAKGIGSAIESPGGTYSSVVGQNLQPSIRHIESHDNDAGNWYYNGQSDTNMYDLMFYQTSVGGGQYNARFGVKAPGCRVFGMHCWGVSDYGLINEADKIEFMGCHIESAAIAKVYAKGRTIFSGIIYEVGSNTSAPAIKLESGTEANFSEFDAVISGCLEWIAFPATVPSLCRFKLRGWVPGATFYSGTAPASALLDLENQATGVRLVQHSADYAVKSLAVTSGIDMTASGIDRIKLIAGNGWAVVSPSAGVLNIASSFVSASSATAADITDITSSAGQAGIMQVTIRNGNVGALTFKQNTSKLRNNGTADKVLSQHESITYINVSGSVWQQTGGK